MDVNALPTILERKRTLPGAEKVFPCRVLERASGAITVLFVSDRVYQAGPLSLPSGTITFGHFWQARPFNVYHWLTPEGATIAHYFNLTDATVITEAELTYLDLTVDVLLKPGGPPSILDADEVPADVPADVRTRISEALAEVLGHATQVAKALESHADQLWPALFGSPRR